MANLYLHCLIASTVLQVSHWRDHDNKLLTSCTNMDDKQAVCKRCNDLCIDVGTYVNMVTVLKIVEELPSGKSREWMCQTAKV